MVTKLEKVYEDLPDFANMSQYFSKYEPSEKKIYSTANDSIASILEIGDKKLAFTRDAWEKRKEYIRYSLNKELEVWIYGIGKEIDESMDLVTFLISPDKIIRTDYVPTPLKVRLLKERMPEDNFKDRLIWQLKRIYAEIEHPWTILRAYISYFIYSTLLKKSVLVSTGGCVWENEFYRDKVRHISECENEEVIYVLHTHPVIFPRDASPEEAANLSVYDLRRLVRNKIRWVELITPYDDLFVPLNELSQAEIWETLEVEFKKWFEENKGKVKEYLF